MNGSIGEFEPFLGATSDTIDGHLQVLSLESSIFKIREKGIPVGLFDTEERSIPGTGPYGRFGKVLNGRVSILQLLPDFRQFCLVLDQLLHGELYIAHFSSVDDSRQEFILLIQEFLVFFRDEDISSPLNLEFPGR